MKATLHTNHGPIVIELFPNEAPKTVKNFVGLAKGEQEYKDDAGRTNPIQNGGLMGCPYDRDKS